MQSGLQSSSPTYIDTPQFDTERNIFVTRVKTSRDFYVTMMVYRNDGVDTSGLLSSKNQQTVAAHEQDLVALVKSTTLTDSPDTPGFGGVLALAGFGAAALVFCTSPCVMREWGFNQTSSIMRTIKIRRGIIRTPWEMQDRIAPGLSTGEDGTGKNASSDPESF